MPARDRLTDPIDAVAVFERDAAGNRTATGWVEPLFPDGSFRVVERNGEWVIQWHAFALATLMSDAETHCNFRKALSLCRVAVPVIDPEDCE